MPLMSACMLCMELVCFATVATNVQTLESCRPKSQVLHAEIVHVLHKQESSFGAYTFYVFSCTYALLHALYVYVPYGESKYACAKYV